MNTANPREKLHKFEPSGSFPVSSDNTLNFGTGVPSCTLAAGFGPTAGSVFVAGYESSITKLDSTTGEEKYVVATGNNTTVTVDPASGQVYTASGSAVNEYDASGPLEATLLSNFSPGEEVRGIVVSAASGDVYVARGGGNSNIEVWGPPIILPDATTGEANPVDPNGATLHGTVSAAGGPEATCEFQYVDDASFGASGFEGAGTAPCVPAGPFIGSGEEAVSAELSGLQIHTTYHYRLLASNENGTNPGQALSFQTLGPAVSGGSVSEVSTTAARISGLIDPNGEATSFVVEYVTEADFLESEYAEATSVPVPSKEIGSGTKFIPVTQQLSGLTPGTTYHFRLVASNPAASVQGADKRFSTFLQTVSGLPDGRVYEMVSPAQKSGEVFPPDPTESLGSSCTIECLPGGILTTLMPMQSAPDGEAVAYEGQPFSGGLAAGANEYLARRAPSPSGWGSQSLSLPQFTVGEQQGYMAFSSDLSRGVLYQIEPALSPDAPAFGGESFANLYLWQSGALQPIITEEPPHRDPGLRGENRFRIVYGGANVGTALAAPLSHVIFAANDALTGVIPGIAPPAPEIEPGEKCSEPGENCNLYEWAGGQLRLVNVLPGNTTTASGAVIGSRPSSEEPPDVDQAISADGSRIFWSDESGQVFVRINGEETQRVEDPGGFLAASADGSKVLLDDGCIYDLEEEECEDLTQGSGEFQGILGASESLSRVYFVDSAALTEESEENTNGEHAEAGEFNLYSWQEGVTTFIGTLLEFDNKVSALEPQIGDWKPSSTRRSAQVSPDGRYLAFMSQAPLTGYDSQGRFEVFEYGAGSGNLTCPSCNPGGQAPLGGSNLSLIGEAVPNPEAPLPGPHNLTAAGQGRLFFESRDVLSPRDTNGHIQDVYEWEPNGVGSCERAGGCVFLISSGNSSGDSMFLNSTPSGDDAFFVTRQQLLPRDKDEKLDLYDARVGGGIEEAAPPPCLGEPCKGPSSSPPAPQSPGTSSFSGPGNEKPARHKHKKRHKHKRNHKRSAKHNSGGSK